MTEIKVVVSGALGKMGLETVKAVLNDNELKLIGLVDIKGEGQSLSSLSAVKGCDLPVNNDLSRVIKLYKPDVLIDFTNPQSVYSNARIALQNDVNCVLGTTGLNDMEIEQLAILSNKKNKGVAIIPNFAIGAVLMMKFAREAAKYFTEVEIIELHHDQKVDAPSGTAIKTAEMIRENLQFKAPRNLKEYEKIAGSRGGDDDGIRIHSIRLPGLVANQEVIFGGPGQTLIIRHDSIDRSSFMPGVVMAVKKILQIKGLVQGMEELM